MTIFQSIKSLKSDITRSDFSLLSRDAVADRRRVLKKNVILKSAALAHNKIVWETNLGQSLGKSLGVLEKSLAYDPIPYFFLQSFREFHRDS